jgi:Uma2 family endonuclease
VILETLVSLEEYLTTDYSPDVDYVDGHLEERNVGEKSHGKLQFRITTLLNAIPNVFAFIETRVRVTPTRYRVPDVCAYLDREPDEEVFTEPPFLVVEILSPEDRMRRTLTVVEDYFRMGVQNVWIVDRWRKAVYVCDPSGGWHAATGQIGTQDARIVVSTDTIFG